MLNLKMKGLSRRGIFSGGLVLGLLLLCFLASCRKPQKIFVRPNILNMAINSDISSLDPANAYDLVSGQVIYQVYETLYEFHYLKRPYTLIPLLAESMPLIQNQGKRYVISLRKNVRYHDNPCFKGQVRFVKAQDFINQIKRLAFMPTRSNGWWLFDGKIVGLNKFRVDAGNDLKLFKSLKVEGLSAPDDNTLVIDLINPVPQFLYFLTMTHSSPIPDEAIDAYQNNLSDEELGTGPFYLKAWKKGLSIELSKYQSYREVYYPSEGDRTSYSRNLLKDEGKKIPFLDGVLFQIIKEGQTRWLNFLAQKIDIIDNIPKDNFPSAITPQGELTQELRAKKIQLEIAPTLTYWWLSFNMLDPVLGSNRPLRQAIAHAIDFDRFIKIFTHSIGLRANSIYPPGIPGYDPSRHLSYSYDPELAKKFLEQAGHPLGKGLPEIIFDVRGSDTSQRQEAEFIKSELAKVGIKIRIQQNSFPAFLQKTRTANLQFWQGGWALDYPDAENVLQLLYSQNAPPGNNVSNYNNKKFDELFNTLKTLDDGEEKIRVMREMEDLIFLDLPWIMTFYARNYILTSGVLKNFRYSDLVFNYVKYLRISQN